jgi:spore coat protein A, manganese oxidase
MHVGIDEIRPEVHDVDSNHSAGCSIRPTHYYHQNGQLKKYLGEICMADRRKFLKTIGGAIVGGGVISSSRLTGLVSAQGPPADCMPLPFPPPPRSPAMTPFVDALPIPPVLKPVGTAPNPHRKGNSHYYEVPMIEVRQKLHRDLPPTKVWGYSGMYPGPTFEVKQGEPIAVKWINNLPEHHIFAASIDRTLHGADHGEPDVRTVVHLHGGKTLPESDGHPEAWFTPGFRQKGPFPNSGIYYYTNDQPAATLWYHDHALAITRLNVMAGLAGMYLIREPGEESLGLPKGDYEIPLIIQDKTFNADGSISYPTVGLLPFVHPQWNPDYAGDTALVNGKVWPYLEVEPRRYRFRILNAANTTFFNLRLQVGGNPGPNFVQIGSDLGFRPTPITMQNLLLANAERADVIVDFSEFDGKDIIMTNDAPNPFPAGFLGNVAQIMQFRVRRKNNGRDQSKIPSRLPAPAEFDLTRTRSLYNRDIVLTEDTLLIPTPPGFCPLHLPTRLLVEGRPWADPVMTEPVAGTTEIWRYINTTVVAHPMHVHLANMRILDRQFFDLDKFFQTGQIVTTGPQIPAAPNELNAPKDTVRVDLGTITRVLVNFDLPSDFSARRGEKLRYVHHCHMLEHEDNDMMRPYDIVIP